MLTIEFWYPFFLIVHVLICLFLILLVLIQNDKGGGLAGALGGVSGGAAFSGASAATIITKITQWTAIIGFAVILTLNALSVKKSGPRSAKTEIGERQSLSNVVPGDWNGATEGVPGLSTPTSNQAIPGVPSLPPSDAKTTDQNKN